MFNADELQEQSTNNIWESICKAVSQVMSQEDVDPSSVHCIAFTATCSLAIFTSDTDEPVSIRGPDFKDTDHNVFLWMDQRASEQTEKINATKHPLLRYLGESISILMEITKVLWLKDNMPADLFNRCTFYDLHDALSHIATGKRRNTCNSACRHASEPSGLGVDGTVKGWSKDFLMAIGLEGLADDNWRQVGGVCEVRV